MLYEIAFSLNLALVVKFVDVNSSLSSLDPALKLKFNALFGISLHSDVGGYLAFFTLASALGVAIFVVVRVVSYAPRGEESFMWGSGPVSLIAWPTSWLYITRAFPALVGVARPWLVTELTAAVCFTVFYVAKRRPILQWVGALLLAAHFGLWTRLVYGGPYFWRAPFSLVFPAVGYCACLAWGASARRGVGAGAEVLGGQARDTVV